MTGQLSAAMPPTDASYPFEGKRAIRTFARHASSVRLTASEDCFGCAGNKLSFCKGAASPLPVTVLTRLLQNPKATPFALLALL